MARCRFVTPDVVRVPLSEGEWLDVKKELTTGDARRMYSHQIKEFRAGEIPTLDPEQVGKTKILAYIVDWSLKDASGNRVRFSASALDALHPEDYQEIADAVDAHEQTVEAAHEGRKNEKTGEPASSAT